MFGEIAAKAISPLVFIILAKILVPEDFGVVAAATVVTSFSQVFWDAGLSKALVQRQDSVEEAANAVFWVNLGLGIGMALLLQLVAVPVAVFFHDPRIAPVLRVLALQLPLAASASVHTALLQKDFHFKRLFWIRLITTCAPACASVPLAVQGAGYWALVAGTLTGQAAQTLTLLLMSPWRPRLGIDKSLTIDLWRFGRWAMLTALLGWFYVWMDAIIVGHYLGAHDMGLYRTGSAFVGMTFGLLIGPILPPLYSIFSCVRNDVSKLREALLFAAKGMTLVSLPIAFAIIALREPIEQLVFGPNWHGIAIIVGGMSVIHGISCVVGANGEAYRALGKPHAETCQLAITFGVYLIGYLIAVRHGLAVFVVARCGLAFLALFVYLVVARNMLDIGFQYWLTLTGRPLLSSFFMFLLLSASTNWLTTSVFSVSVQIAIGLLTYGALILTMEHPYLQRAIVVATKRAYG